MRLSSPILLSAFLATVTGQTLTYEFPPTGTYTSRDTKERYQVCVKGAKWADLITTNVEEEAFRFDISSLDFKNGDKIDGRWNGRYAVNVPDSFACKGGILFQHDDLRQGVSLDLTLKATLADGESKLTVCAFYSHYVQGDWQNILQGPERGFTFSSNVFELATTSEYGQGYDPAKMHWFQRAQTLCRDFEPGVDDGFFSEAEPLPKPVTFTFPQVGPTGIMPGICINRAQFASATNSVVDYPKYEMSTRQFNNYDNLWMDRYWWETNRNKADYPLKDNSFDWAPDRQGRWTAGNPCDGSLYLQPQRLEQTGYYEESPRWTNQYLRLLDADKERLATNEITVEILPKENETSVQICALIKMTDQTTNWLNLEDYGFTTEGINAGIGSFGIYCKDVSPPTKSPTKPPTNSPTIASISAPTTPPTTNQEPTTEPTSVVAAMVCPSDVRLLRTDGVTPFPPIDFDVTPAVNIVSQDVSTVTVELNQAWNTPVVEKYFYEFRQDGFTNKCFEIDDVETGAIIDTITIQCNIISPVAFLKICLQESTGSFLGSNDNGMVGKCCHTDAPEGTPTVCYHLEIKCEAECLEDGSRARYLRGL